MTVPSHFSISSLYLYILQNRRLACGVIVFLLLISCIFILDRSLNHEYSMDEVTYHYKIQSPNFQWIEHEEMGYVNEGLLGFTDVIESQWNHLKLWNGRYPVHFIIQLGALYGDGWIIALNLLFFCGLVISLMWLCVPPKGMRNPLIWLILIATLIYLSPNANTLYTSINISPNYIWPGFLSILFLIFFRDVARGRMHGRILMAVVAFLLGWSHEGFSVPLSASVGLYFFPCLHRFRGRILWLVVPLWIGTILVLASPALYNRIDSATDLPVQSGAIWMLFHLARQKLFVLYLVFSTFYLIKHRDQLKEIFYRNRVFLYTLCFSIIVTMIGRSGLRSFFLGDLMCVVMMLKVVGRWQGWRSPGKLQGYAFVVTFIFFCASQWMICLDNRKGYAAVRTMVERLKASPDGVFLMPDVTFNPLVAEYIVGPSIDYGVYPGSKYSSIQALNDCLDKHFYPMTAASYGPVVAPDSFFIPENRIAGDAPVYYTPESGYWLHPDSVAGISRYSFYIEPYSWQHLPSTVAPKVEKFMTVWESRPKASVGVISNPRGTGYPLSTLYNHKIIGSRLRVAE